MNLPAAGTQPRTPALPAPAVPGSAGVRKVSGAELLRDELVRQGVRVMFGHPGGAILPFYDVLFDAPEPRHILVRHEQAAAHAADGFARSTGSVGVCIATSGPGATNLVTGLATALADGVPVVAITGQVSTAVLGTDAFQEADTLGIMLPVTKHAFQLRNPAEIPQVVAEAFRIARSGRPGPVLIDVPKDVQFATIELPSSSSSSGPGDDVDTARQDGRSPAASAVGYSFVDGQRTTAGAAIASALSLLRGARRPVLVVGRGVVTAGIAEPLREMAEATGLPVVTTLLGLDAFPTLHPQCLGMPGMHGTERANQGIAAADLVIGLGIRFDDRMTGDVRRFAPEARIVHFDIDPRAHLRTIRTDVAVLGDLRETFPPFARGAMSGVRASEGWWERLQGWMREAEAPLPDGVEEDPDAPLTGRAVARALAERIRLDRAIVATDVGQHQMWFAQELADSDPRTHLTSGGLGTMGFALPAAMGAAVACPDRAVWAVAGDGGFQMVLQELATIVQEQLPVRIAIVNNASLGMVRQWQTRIHGGRRSQSDLSAPDFIRLAAAFGIHAERVERTGDLRSVLREAAAHPGAILLDLRIIPEDEVYPMVRPGAALHEMWMQAADAGIAG